jgi:hypothetical protein
MSEWQPIETVPKNGTIVDLWIQLPGSQTGYRVAGAEWLDGEWKHYSLPEFGHSLELCRLDWQHCITHWMPLPKPPTI